MSADATPANTAVNAVFDLTDPSTNQLFGISLEDQGDAWSCLYFDGFDVGDPWGERGDLIAADAVDMFVGFGGVVRRQMVERDSGIFVTTPSLTPILALAGGSAAGDHVDLGASLEAFHDGGVTFADPAVASRFAAAFDIDEARLVS